MPPSSKFSWDVSLSGTATVAGQTVNAAVFLQGGKTAVLALDAIPTIQLSALFDSFFNQLTWPSDLLDLTLSETQIFYIYQGADLNQISGLPPAILNQQSNGSKPGLFVATDISLELAGNFAGSALITVIANQGFSATGTLSDRVDFLDAGLLYLTAPGSSSGGPTLSLQSFGTRQFTLNCGCQLFGEELIDSVLTLSTASPQLTAQLKSDDAIAPFGQPLELDFTWDRSNGLVIRNFPSLSFQNLLIDNFAQLLKAASKAKNCGDLADLAFKDGFNIQTVFKVKPSLKSVARQVRLVIEGYYKLGVAGRQVGIINFPPISFRVPSDLTFDGISDSLISDIVSDGELMLEALWDNKGTLALFFMVIMTKQALKSVISELVCEDLKEELEQLDDVWDPPPDPPPTTPGSGGGGGGAAGAGEAMGGLITAGLAAFKKAGDVGKDLGNDLASGLSSLGSSIFGDDDDDDSGPPEPPATINATYLAATNELVVDWLSQAFFRYDVQLVDATGHVLWTTQVEANSDLFNQDPDTVSMSLVLVPLVSGVYTAKVRVEFFFTITDWTTTTIAKLASPANVILSADATGELVRLQWLAVAFATEYAVVMQDALTNTVVASRTFSSAAGAGVGLTQDFSAGGLGTQAAASYVATVTALAGSAAIPSETAATATPLPKLAAPASVNQSVMSGALQVSWTSVSNQTNYRIIVMNESISVEALNLQIEGPTIGTTGLIERDFAFDQFKVKSPGQYVTIVSVLGDSTHIASNPTMSSTFDVLFSGIGNMQIGTTFTVS